MTRIFRDLEKILGSFLSPTQAMIVLKDQIALQSIGQLPYKNEMGLSLPEFLSKVSNWPNNLKKHHRGMISIFTQIFFVFVEPRFEEKEENW